MYLPYLMFALMDPVYRLLNDKKVGILMISYTQKSLHKKVIMHNLALTLTWKCNGRLE